MSVSYVRDEYTANLPRWEIVDDTQKGQIQVKKRGETYLPFYGSQPRNKSAFDNDDDWNEYYTNFQQLTQDQRNRYKNYIKRAIFYNYISPTVGGLVGMATKEPLVIDLGKGLQFAIDDIDGAGTSLEQQYKRAVELTVKHARDGILVDYPPTSGEVTQEQINQGVARSYATLYNTKQIINWGEERIGADSRLNLVVLLEVVQKRDEDGYGLSDETQYRVLRLVDGLYESIVFTEKLEVVEGPFYPTNADGNRLDYIPFQFIGAINNDVQVDESPLYDIAALNIGHYINSADNESGLWYHSTPQPWMSGIDQQWLRENGGLSVGSGSLIPVPAGETFGYAEVKEKPSVRDEMGHKENQMLAMGAKMLTADSSFNSATEAAISNQSETSFLQSVIDNVTDGYTNVLEWMAAFEGSEVIEFNNPTDLAVFMADPQMAAQITQQWMSGLISKEDARDYMRKIGTLERTNEEIDDLVAMDDTGLNLDAE